MTPLALALALAARTVFSFTDPAIDESSGLVDLGSMMVTANDSGDDAVLYLIDPASGDTVGRTEYAASVQDVEALAPAGNGVVWAADIGDNRAARPDVQVYRVPIGPGARTVDAPSYRLVYPAGPRDAESLFLAAGRLYVVAKGVFGGDVYVAPRRLDPDSPNRMRTVGRVSVFATDAALLPDGRHVLVRGYDEAEIRTVPGFVKVAAFGLPFQEQGEAVSISRNGRIRLSSEGAHAKVLQVTLPARVRAMLRPPGSPGPQPAPAALAQRIDDDPSAGSGVPTGMLVPGAGLLALIVAGVWTARRRTR